MYWLGDQSTGADIKKYFTGAESQYNHRLRNVSFRKITYSYRLVVEHVERCQVELVGPL